MKIKDKAYSSYNTNKNVEPSEQKPYELGFEQGYKQAQRDFNEKIKEYKKQLEQKSEKLYHDYNDYSIIFYRKDIIDMLNYFMQM
jgi:hypothetical protein